MSLSSISAWAVLVAVALNAPSPNERGGGGHAARTSPTDGELQGDLAGAADAAARAWLAHDAAGLVGRSQGLVLQIPGADPSAALGRAQAIELLRRHFQSATERSVAVATARELESGRGVVELDRQYVVRGTTDQRRETVFLGFRMVQGQWILSEVRTAQ